MAMIRSGLHKALAAEADILRREYSVEWSGLFGFYASRDQDEESDVDLFVDLAQPVGFVGFVNSDPRSGKPATRGTPD